MNTVIMLFLMNSSADLHKFINWDGSHGKCAFVDFFSDFCVHTKKMIHLHSDCTSLPQLAAMKFNKEESRESKCFYLYVSMYTSSTR